MSITFRIADTAQPALLPPAEICMDQFRAIVSVINQHSNRRGRALVTWHYGQHLGTSCDTAAEDAEEYDVDDPICATVIASAIPLAGLSSPADHNEKLVSLIDEAQWQGRQLEFTRRRGSTTVTITISDDQDKVPAIEVSTHNGYAILSALGLSETAIGSVTLRQLRSIFHHRKFSISGLLRYLPTFSAFSEYQGDPDQTRMEWS